MQLVNTVKNRFQVAHHSIANRVQPIHIIIGVSILCSASVAAYTLQFYIPDTKSLSFSEMTCNRKVVLLPKLHTISADKKITANFSDTTQIAGYPIMAQSVCARMTDITKENTSQTVRIQPLGMKLFGSSTKLTVPALPVLKASETTTAPSIVTVKETLQFKLDKPDTMLTYKLSAGQQEMTCEAQNETVACDLSKLSLLQAHTYTISLQQHFQEKKLATLTSRTVTTVTPITITASSIANGTMVYDKPDSVSLTLDKHIASHTGIRAVNAKGEELATTTTNKENILIITFAKPLPRDETITITASEIKAADKGFLKEPYVLSFKTSTGPKVIGSSISSYNVSPSSTIRLSFDTAPKPETLSQFIQLHGNGGIIPAKLTTSGNAVVVAPNRGFDRCESFTIKVLEGLENTYGVTGQTAWQQQSRSTCRLSFSIGTSVEGRAITAYKFGNGPSTVLYIGATHGSEPSSKYTLDSWVEYLESRAPEIPAHRSIVVIPSINPDGIAKGSRTNSRGVDLNRNFPANNWKADVTIPGGQLVTNGGGTAPLSEPESAAIAAYTLALKPRLVLTYHAKGSIVTANESGDSMNLATMYGRLVGYRAVAESQLGNTFNYDTTGAYENWLHDKADIPTLLIELPGNTSNYFSTNRAAMWSMVTL